MSNFPTITIPKVVSVARSTRRTIQPTAIQSRQISQGVIKNTNGSSGSFALANGVTTTLTTTFWNESNDEIRLSAVPFMITFFEAASLSACVPGTNQIPFDVATDRFNIWGPIAMPDYTINGKRVTSGGTRFASDGNNVVYKTSIVNNSGGDVTITYILSLRLIESRGGGSS
jgi:hypothetical protein